MGFTIDTFARFYAKEFGVDRKKLAKYLWGDHYYDSKAKKWQRSAKAKNGGGAGEGRTLPRGFCKFVVEPLRAMTKAVKAEKQDKVDKLLKKYGVELSPKQLATVKRPKDYLKLIMGEWLPAGDNILEMVLRHLPNPAQAQRYRGATLYSGPPDDEACQAIQKCDPNGPLMFYVSKMVRSSDGERFFALGRVFSGTIQRATPVRILGADFVPGDKRDLHVKSVARTVVMMADRVAALDDCPAGSICALAGIDQFINKNATITTLASAHTFHAMKFSVSPVVRVAVETKRPRDLPKLIEGLKLLKSSDQIVQVIKSKTGENIIAGAGELHIETALHDLQHVYMKDIEITVSKPVVSYCESIRGHSPHDLLAKAPNKLNRLWMRAEPLDAKLCDEIEEGTVSARDDPKERARHLAATYPATAAANAEDPEKREIGTWTLPEARRIWALGHATDAPANVLVDATKGVDYLHDVKDTIVASFNRESAGGILCDEPLRGVRFNLTDAKLHSDPAHRGAGAIMPTTRRVMCAALLASKPCLLEPVYRVEIVVSNDEMSGVYSTLAKARGEVQEVLERDGQLHVIRAHLPVAESFGFNGELRGATKGKAFPQMSFSHWQPVSGDPLEDGSVANKIVREIRARKGMPAKLPSLELYHERL